MKLHHFFRSGTSHRLRIALNLKGLAVEHIPVDLRREEHLGEAYRSVNPQMLVPALEHGGQTFIQSPAIIEWLDETHPAPPLLPRDADGRARVRALAYMVACEIHPLNNLRVLGHLAKTFGADEAAQKAWFTHWVTATFDALETTLARDAATGRFCHGDTPGLADLCLYAQVWNNRRFDISPDPWPTIARIFKALDDIPAFADAAPPRQPDAA